MAKTTRAPAVPERPRRSSGSAKAKKRAARLAAVQALYQMDLAGTRPDTVVAEFLRGSLCGEVDGERFVSADPDLFSAIVQGVASRTAVVDQMVESAAARKVERLELLMRAILRAGAYELFAHAEIHPKIIINEYLDVAHAFFAGREPGMVNGVLDRVARVVREEEMGERVAGRGSA